MRRCWEAVPPADPECIGRQVPFMLLYHPLVTWLGYPATAALDAFRGCAYTATLFSLYATFQLGAGWTAPRSSTLATQMLIACAVFFVIMLVGAQATRSSFGQYAGANCDATETRWGCHRRLPSCRMRPLPEPSWGVRRHLTSHRVVRI